MRTNSFWNRLSRDFFYTLNLELTNKSEQDQRYSNPISPWVKTILKSAWSIGVASLKYIFKRDSNDNSFIMISYNLSPIVIQCNGATV